MRLINKWSVFTIFLFVVNLSFADGVTKTRSSCNGSGWKWKARSRVTNLGVPVTDKETKCYKLGSYPDTYASNNCAYQSATNNWGVESQYGAVTRWYWRCARGKISSPLYYDLIKGKLNEQPYGYEESRVTCESTIFSEVSVVKKGINASLFVLGKNLFSSLEIIMWLPDENLGYEDSIPTKDKTFWKGKIVLVNGEVKLEGDFPTDCFELKQRKVREGVEYNLIISDLTIEAEYPEGINESSLIEVAMITDAGVYEELAFEEAIKNGENSHDFSISVYPNPTSNIIYIDFNSENQIQDNIITIKLYHSNGTFVKAFNFNSSSVSRNKVILNFQSLGLDSGLYYLLVSSGEKNQLKKIIFNK